MHERLRMLMNSQPDDGSPGGGAPDGTGAPSAPAQGAAAPDVLGQVKELIAGEMKGIRDGIFADLRRSGALGKEKQPEAAQPSGDRPLTAADVERISRREREFGRLTSGLTDDQAALMERLYRAERPDDADLPTWVRTTRTTLGFDRQGGVPTHNQPRNLAAPTGPPVSDAGSPAAPHVVTEDTPLMQLSAEDRMHLLKTKGAAWYNATLRAQLKGVRVVLKKP